MDGYNIQIEGATQGAAELKTIIEGLEVQIKQIETIESEMLNDSLWYGPNKSLFMNRMSDYKTAVNGLYNNAVEHHAALQQVISAYARAEG